jgi:hypothetical protein
LNPLPWLLVGIALFISGIVAHTHRPVETPLRQHSEMFPEQASLDPDQAR